MGTIQKTTELLTVRSSCLCFSRWTRYGMFRWGSGIWSSMSGYTVLPCPGTNNFSHNYCLNDTPWSKSKCERNLGVLVSCDIRPSVRCVQFKKQKKRWNCREDICNEISFRLCGSALVNLRLNEYKSVGNSTEKNDRDDFYGY